jgi:hypothetical protein
MEQVEQRAGSSDSRSPAHGCSDGQAVGELLGAARLLNRRGAGSLAWAAPFREDPIAFLLDSMSDGMIIWAIGGELLYQNRAAAELGAGSRSVLPNVLPNPVPLEAFSSSGRHFERRSLRCRAPGVDYILEIIREVSPGSPGVSASDADDTPPGSAAPGSAARR